MKSKTFIKLMVPMLIIVFLAGAAVAETGKEDTGFIVKKSAQLKADKTVSEATLSPLPGVFGAGFSPEELSRMPGNPQTYAEAVNPPAGLSPEELIALNEKIIARPIPKRQLAKSLGPRIADKTPPCARRSVVFAQPAFTARCPPDICSCFKISESSKSAALPRSSRFR